MTFSISPSLLSVVFTVICGPDLSILSTLAVIFLFSLFKLIYSNSNFPFSVNVYLGSPELFIIFSPFARCNVAITLSFVQP